MKKLLAVVLVLTLVLSMGVMAFATDGPPTEVPVEKDFNLVNDIDGIVSPAEEFEFTITGVEETEFGFDVPEFNPNTFKIDFNQGAASLTKTAQVGLPDYDQVGIYTYRIEETDGGTAGVGYDERELILTVVVINGENGPEVDSMFIKDDKGKVDGFINTYSAGNLEISKEVTGNLGDKDRYFSITVELEVTEGNILTVPVVYNGGQYTTDVPVTFTDGKATLNLEIKHEDTITIENLPYGVTYTVVENIDAADGYTVTGEVKTATAIGGAKVTVPLVNDKDQDIPTGVNLDNLPYILILGAVTIGLFGFTMKRRFNNR